MILVTTDNYSNYIVNGAYNPTYNWVAPHCSWVCLKMGYTAQNGKIGNSHDGTHDFGLWSLFFFGTQFSDAECRDFHELSLVNSELRRVYHFQPQIVAFSFWPIRYNSLVVPHFLATCFLGFLPSGPSDISVVRRSLWAARCATDGEFSS